MVWLAIQTLMPLSRTGGSRCLLELDDESDIAIHTERAFVPIAQFQLLGDAVDLGFAEFGAYGLDLLVRREAAGCVEALGRVGHELLVVPDLVGIVEDHVTAIAGGQECLQLGREDDRARLRGVLDGLLSYGGGLGMRGGDACEENGAERHHGFEDFHAGVGWIPSPWLLDGDARELRIKRLNQAL